MEMREIPGFPSYWCSEDGEIYSAKRSGSFVRMKKAVKRTGYESIALMVGSTYRYPLVHRLVLETFKGPARGLHCNHKNGIRSDNRLENLEWVTRAENERHARSVLGKKLHGEHHPVSKLKPADIVEIRRLKAEGQTYNALSQRFGVGISQLARIVKGEKWRHI